MRTVAIVIARMGSSRLPGKSLLTLPKENEKISIVKYIYKRLLFSTKLDDIIYAIPDTKDNDVLSDELKKNKIKHIRGSEEDVLSRVIFAGVVTQADVIVEITADCPFVDPIIIQSLLLKKEKYDVNYISNTITRSYPDGFDVQCYDYEHLEHIKYFIPEDSTFRSSVGWNLINLSNQFFGNFKMINVAAPEKYHLPHWGLTLDTKEDYELIYKIAESFKDNIIYRYYDIIDFLLKNSELLEINSSIKRNIPGTEIKQ